MNYLKKIKDSNLFYYSKGFFQNSLPSIYYKRYYQKLKEYEKQCSQEDLQGRLSYYLKVTRPFELKSDVMALKDFKRTKGTGYYLDLKEFSHYFSRETKFDYFFGDQTHSTKHPCLFKARKIGPDNENSVLFKLNKRRHFQWVDDPFSFSKKKNILVWRGTVAPDNKWREELVQKFWNHTFCDVGQTNKMPEQVPWVKNHLSKMEHLENKFICCPEGNDVATNLKWAMSSNSLCFMPKPRFETWFMEGTLLPNIHYVEIKEDFSDLEEKIGYYSKNVNEAEFIVANAHKHVEQFKDIMKEDLLCLMVLQKYAQLSGQVNFLRF